MNERIKELAEQAGINCVVPTVGTLEYPSKGEVDHLKSFAELIVREVFLKIEDERFEIYQPVKESVMKYFGVEE